jgi:phage-related protein (TIGR01555 family)
MAGGGLIQRATTYLRQQVHVIVNDTWTNLLTSMGRAGLDKRESTMFVARNPLDLNTLQALFSQDDLSRKIVTRWTEEMTREWVDADCGEAGQTDMLNDELDRLRVRDHITDADTWGRLYGGAIMILGVDDGQDFGQPLDMNNIREFMYLEVIDRWQCFPLGVEDDARSPYFGSPLYYRLIGGQVVHHSRVIRFDGAKVPPIVLKQIRWHESVLEPVFNTVRDYASGMGGMSAALQDYSVTTIGMTGLANSFAMGKSELIINRAAAAQATMSMFRVMLHDSEKEQVTRLAHNLSGMPEAIDRLVDRVASAADTPKAILFGNSIGKVSGADNDLKIFYDRVKVRQTNVLIPALNRISKLVFLAKFGPFRGKEPVSWNIKPRPLWQMSEADKADIYLKKAQADLIYVRDIGAVSAFEVRMSRFADDDQETGISLDEDVTAMLELNKMGEALATGAPVAAAAAGQLEQEDPDDLDTPSDAPIKGAPVVSPVNPAKGPTPPSPYPVNSFLPGGATNGGSVA